ncbi:phage major capsid protein [Chryseobacterium koreense]|uniref:Capsid protein n=1 Tax=Chryseobacterium koreense CCUG 49689 TaxID=1304281 RepID=A0A0J7LMB5_9FLAO|nr:hypothetical protein [Chryseobacterium koreense]KMQ70235.1 hypothetical protein ACM44_13355 [Chryseobacterium koreense CCUG 49689]MBB5334735.1 hypothetical protein [Chryseobacterium koreense]
MPANFPEVWSSRVIQLLTTQNVAPWLDGIPELDTEVIEVGSGATSETNLIHLPVETFQPEVLLNNTTYPIAVQEFTDTEVIIKLDKYQTKATSLSDDQVIGASYQRIDSATRGHVVQINSMKYRKAIHAQAPAGDTVKTPVITVDYTDANTGSAKAEKLFEAIVALKDKFDQNEVPEEGRRLVLATAHQNILLLDRNRFGDLVSNLNTGKVAPMLAGFEIYSYVANPKYTAAGAKLAFGAIPGETDKVASVAFHKDNVAKKTGMTKQYFQRADTDPKNQTNLINYRHYFIAMPAKNEMIGAII